MEYTLDQAIDLDLPQTTRDLIRLLREVHPQPDALVISAEDATAPMPWAVWDRGPDEDIIGTGDTMSEALAAALATARNWQHHAATVRPTTELAEQLEARSIALMRLFEAATVLTDARDASEAHRALRNLQTACPALWIPPHSETDNVTVWQGVLTRMVDRIEILLDEQLIDRVRMRAQDILVIARVLGIAFEVECRMVERKS